MHAIKEKPVVVNGKIEIRPIMVVALTYDHRRVHVPARHFSDDNADTFTAGFWTAGKLSLSLFALSNISKIPGSCCTPA